MRFTKSTSHPTRPRSLKVAAGISIGAYVSASLALLWRLPR